MVVPMRFRAKLYIRELVKSHSTRRETERETRKVLTRLLSQVDEQRNPRTEATVDQLLDRWLDVIDVERTTRAGYLGKIEKHVRPTIGHVPVARLNAELIDSPYASLRRRRDHCRGKSFIAHRVEGDHVRDDPSANSRRASAASNAPTRPARSGTPTPPILAPPGLSTVSRSSRRA